LSHAATATDCAAMSPPPRHSGQRRVFELLLLISRPTLAATPPPTAHAWRTACRYAAAAAPPHALRVVQPGMRDGVACYRARRTVRRRTTRASTMCAIDALIHHADAAMPMLPGFDVYWLLSGVAV